MRDKISRGDLYPKPQTPMFAKPQTMIRVPSFVEPQPWKHGLYTLHGIGEPTINKGMEFRGPGYWGSKLRSPQGLNLKT